METYLWKQVEQLFEQALDQPLDERDAFLERECPDAQVRDEVKSLLANKDAAPNTFLVRPKSSPSNDDDVHGLIERKLGQFEITDVIAVGGMGTVYAGRQQSPNRTVAVKVLARWLWSTHARRRFELESTILARLSHPCIAQVYEAGCHDGVPYFAMEFVREATPITSYAVEHELSAKERMALFIQACEGVQYGHLRGVIHRDLKPENILINGDGYVKIVDFGIARVTDSDAALTTVRTDLGQVLGTLQYMSPEQCAGDPLSIDMRSDVYSLGVILYELLCGTLPYDLGGSSIATAARIISEQQPLAPRSVNKRLDRNVELVLLRSLAKDPEQRYESVSALTTDVQNVLSGDPVIARRPTLWSRALRMLARHPVVSSALASTAVGAAIIAAAVAGAMWAQSPELVRVSLDNREVRVVSFGGTTLRRWTTPGPAPLRALPRPISDPSPWSNRKLVVLGYGDSHPGTLQGRLCAFNAAGGEDEPPIWHSGIEAEDMPPDILATSPDVNFGVHRLQEIEIFSNLPGPELVAIFACRTSLRVLCIYSLDGDLLYRAWHDGPLFTPVYWMAGEERLLFTGRNDEVLWPARGHAWVRKSARGPWIVAAIQPKIGEIHQAFLCTGSNDDCVRPSWYCNGSA